MQSAGIVLLLGVFSCARTDTAAALRAVADGSRPRAAVTLSFREERPREHALEMRVDGRGHVRITRESPRPDCPEVWEQRCWTVSSNETRLKESEHRRLIGMVAEAELAKIPREEAAVPGGSRLMLVVNIEGLGREEILTSQATASRYQGLRGARQAFLSLIPPTGVETEGSAPE